MRYSTFAATLILLAACSDGSNVDNTQTTNLEIKDQLLSSESSPFFTGYELEGEIFVNDSNCLQTDTPVGAVPFYSNSFSPINSDTYNHTSTYQIFDSIGADHTLDVYYVKICDKNWQAHVLVDERDVGEPLIGSVASRKTINLTFDSEGALSSENLHLISYWSPLDLEGQDNGALGPLPISSGGTLPVAIPPTSSNFTIDLEQVSLQ